MAKKDIINEVKSILSKDLDFLKPLLKSVMQEILEREMDEVIGAEHYERGSNRTGYRAGYYPRQLVTRVGALDLRIPRDREGKFSTALFERYERSEKSLLAALTEMYIQGVSTRKIKLITEELCGHEFSASMISLVNKTLDTQLKTFAQRKLERLYPYIILDARYEKVREDGIVRSQALLIALGINEEGKREVLAVQMANKESQTSWKEFLLELRERGLNGVEFVVSDDHSGLKKAIAEIFPGVAWQRCYVHFLRNAFSYLPKNGDLDCMQELRWIYERRNYLEAQEDLRAWIKKWGAKYTRFSNWVEENIAETLSFYALPQPHHKHMKSTNLLERLNEEIKRRTFVVRIFPSTESCLRLTRALAVEIHESWEDKRYLNMNLLFEMKKQKLLGLEKIA